jgi:hypothetical protein
MLCSALLVQSTMRTIESRMELSATTVLKLKHRVLQWTIAVCMYVCMYVWVALFLDGTMKRATIESLHAGPPR